MKILVQFLLATILVFELTETKTTKPADDEPVKTIQEIFEVEEPHVKKSPSNNQAPVYEHTSYVSYKIQDPNMVLNKNIVPIPPDFEDSELHNRDTVTNSPPKKITDTLQTQNSIEKNQTCVGSVESHSDAVMRATVSKELLTFLLGMLTKEDLDVIYSSGSKSRDFIPADIIRKFMKKLLENLTPKDNNSFQRSATRVTTENNSYRSRTTQKTKRIPQNVLKQPPIPYFLPPATYIPQPLPIYYPLPPYFPSQSKKYSDFYGSGRKLPFGPHPPFMSGIPDITNLERLHSPDFMDMEEKFPAHKFQHHNYYSRSRSPKNTVKAEHVSNVKFDKIFDDDDFLEDFFDR